MGEGITGFVSAVSGKSQVVISITGEISPGCLSLLKMLIKNWAEQCGVQISAVGMKVKKKPKKRRKKKK